MLINFFHPRLKPTIECSTLTSEGFEVGNLISEDFQLFEKGFLAERFVSGPVILTIKFICPVTLKNIIIWPKVGSQRSIGFELTSLKHSKNTVIENEDYQKFATGVSKLDVNTVIFHKEGYTIDAEKFGDSFRRTFFRCKHHENITSIRIKIFKSHFVAALKKLEIWAEPSHSCDWKTKKYVRGLWSQISKPSIQADVSCSIEERPEVNVRLPDVDGAQIPEEFYDQITHEIMTLPILLPSGKVIDQRTLERCQKEEERWGRLPSDPFTGLVFTENSKPKIDVYLKSKIDEFLLKNSDVDQIKYMPRRLGSNRELTCRSGSTSMQYCISKIINNGTENKRECESEASSSKKVKLDNENSEFINKSGNNKPYDLNKMLADTLSNLPSYLNAPKSKAEIILKCILCSVSEQLYRFPCDHILCRTCTIQKQNYCSRCTKSYNFSQIQKIHPNKNLRLMSAV